jgi:hypothetical protein
VRKTAPEGFYSLRCGLSFDLNHDAITLATPPHHRTPLNPLFVLDADSIAERVEALALRHFVERT